MDPHELYGRYRELQKYLGWTDDDASRVAAASDLLAPQLPSLVDDFCQQVDRHTNTRRVITGGRQQVLRLKENLTAWLHELFSKNYDRAFVVRRWKVGSKHVEIGLEQTYTSAALARLRMGLCRALKARWQGDNDLLVRTIESLNMLLDMDLAIIQDAYEDELKARLRCRRPARKPRATDKP